MTQEDPSSIGPVPLPLSRVVGDIALVVNDEKAKTKRLEATASGLLIRVHALEMQLRVAWAVVVVLATANVVLTGVDLATRLARH